MPVDNLTLHEVPGRHATAVIDGQPAELREAYRVLDDGRIAWHQLDQDCLACTLRIERCIGGTITFLGVSNDIFPAETWRTLKTDVDSSGLVTVYEGPQGAPAKLVSASDSALATGGTLASGGYGIYDENATASALPARSYDNFVVEALAPSDAVLYASQKAQITTQGMYRLDAGGTAYGPIMRALGDLPRLPVGGTVEVFVKASRGDFGQVADSGIDDIAARVFYKPTWLTFPG